MKTSRLIDKIELGRKHPALVQHKYTLHWLVRSKQIPFVKIGGRILFDELAVDAWIERQRVEVIESSPAKNSERPEIGK